MTRKINTPSINKKVPIFSIVIPTFNSMKTLGETLASIKNQSYPKDKIETLVIDGGSTDETLSIAKKYKVKIILNKRIELIYAKHIGFIKARGRYLLFLDSDEVLDNPNSLEYKLYLYKKNENVKAVIPSGYKTARGWASINYYINEFGDPFTFFMYRESKDDIHLLDRYRKKFNIVSEDKYGIILNFQNYSQLPYIELWSGGCSIDLHYARTTFPFIKKDPSPIALLFYLLVNKDKYLGVVKNDPTLHYSAESVFKYLKKIKSRVKNNIFINPMGRAGFSGREDFEKWSVGIKKYLFILYAYSIILPCIDSLYLAITRKKPIYLMHLPLTLYTATLTIYFYVLKIIKINVAIKTWGN